MALPFSPELIFVNEGYPFNFSCGPSADPLEMISVTLNDNQVSTGIVTRLSGSRGQEVLFQYRATTRGDNGTTITCTAGQDMGIIKVTVFCKFPYSMLKYKTTALILTMMYWRILNSLCILLYL